MIELAERDANNYFIQYTGSDKKEFLDFTCQLGLVKSRFFDYHKSCWCCGRIEARKIYDNMNNKEIGNKLKLKPYGYQRQAIKFCIDHGSGLICLPCGAGKTPVGLGICASLRDIDDSIRGVIVVKASLKEQWLNEVSKFTDYKAIILDTFKSATSSYAARIRSRKKKIDALSSNTDTESIKKIAAYGREIDELTKKQQEDFKAMFDTSKYDLFIVNYETITDDSVKAMLHKINPQFWYVDEIDCIKNPKAIRSKAIYEFNTAKYRFGATATPIRKNPKDLYGIFTFIRPELFPNEREFDRTYLRFYYGRVSGSQNEEQLAAIVAPYIFKRSFDEIADQLPTQSVFQVYCTLTPKQIKMNERLQKEIDEFNEQMRGLYARFSPAQLEKNEEYRKLKDGIAARQTFAQMLADSEELLEASESHMAHSYITKSPSSKVETCVAMIEKIVESGEKVCVFSKYLGIQKILDRELAKSPECKGIVISHITGSTTQEERTAILRDYNTKDNHKILLLSDSGEAGLNLSSTKYLIEFELAESAAKQTQRHGRIQRADSIHKNVFVYQLIAKDSWDEIAMKIVNKKQGYADRIL